jgi:segregation and condensation protein B
MTDAADPIERTVRMIEAILFASAEPMTEKALAARLPEGADVAGALGHLAAWYDRRGVQLVQRGGAWAFRTAPDLAEVLTVEAVDHRKLSRAALETLAIVAYHQPVTRAEIEEIRGVAVSRGTLDVLLEAGWIQPRGRRQTPGRPLTWGTTDGFLDHFGLQSVKDLPGIAELRAAGLLDARPALAAYGARASDDDDPAGDGTDDDDALTVGADAAAGDPDAPALPLGPGGHRADRDFDDDPDEG